MKWQERDIDPEEDNGVDNGAWPTHNDNSYSTCPRKCLRQGLSIPEEEECDNRRPSNLHPNDPGNFLKLCTALRILVKKRITDAELDVADTHIQEYAKEPMLVSPIHENTVNTLIVLLAVWCCRDVTQSPLCHSYGWVCTQLWTIARVLDVPVWTA